MKRVGIIGLLQESNTFLPSATTLEHFREDVLLTGAAVRDYFADSHHEIGGFFEQVSASGFEAVPIFAARALPYGVIAADAFAELLKQMMHQLERAGRLDGLLLAAHGATVSEEYRDADGHWLSLVRRYIGPGIPICTTLDPHANVSPAMVAACDALVAYRTNPHLDQRDRGREAAALLIGALEGKFKPVTRAAFPPMAIGIEAQLTSASPCREFYERTRKLAEQPGVLSHSIILGFPYADVAEMGSSVIFVTDDDPTLAAKLADAAGRDLWQQRADFAGVLIDVDRALERALALEPPICLLDMGDNVGGGSPGDATHLLHAIHNRRLQGFVCICDPAAVEQARSAGVGAKLQLQVGGHSGPPSGKPLEAQFEVVSLHDGVFQEHEPRHGGFTRFDQGPTAIVRAASGATVMLTTRRMAPFSLQQLISCGVDPNSFQVITAKGVHAPVEAYRHVCRHLVRVDTPGVTSADMRRLEYRHRRRPMFPFESETTWPLSPPKPA